MAVGSNAITTLAKTEAHLRLHERDARYQGPAIDVYYGGADSAATVEVTSAAVILNDETVTTTTITFAAQTTITAMVAAINAVSGWVATALTHGDAASSDLIEFADTSCLAATQRQTLEIVRKRDLELIIDGVTAEIETYLGRAISSRTFSETYHYQRGTTVQQFALFQPEVTQVTRLAVETQESMRVLYGGSDAYARVEVTGSSVVLSDVTTGTTTSAFATDTTIADVVSTLDAISGWTVTTVNDGPSSYLVQEGVRNAKGVTRSLYSWQDFDQDYVVDYEAGVLTLEAYWWPYSLNEFWMTSQRRVLVEYTAGYSTVPDDLQMIAWEMAGAVWNGRGRDERLASESLGSYSYSMSSLPADDVAAWKRRLAKYKRWLP